MSAELNRSHLIGLSKLARYGLIWMEYRAKDAQVSPIEGSRHGTVAIRWNLARWVWLEEERYIIICHRLALINDR